MQEAVRGVGGGAAGVVAHPDGEDGVLAGGHGHAGARRDLQDDQAEAGGDGVGEAAEGGVLAVAAEQLGVLGVTGGEQLGLQPEGDEPGRVGGVGGGHRGVRGRDGGGGSRGLAPRGVLGVVVAHGWVSSAVRVVRVRVQVSLAAAPPDSALPVCLVPRGHVGSGSASFSLAGV